MNHQFLPVSKEDLKQRGIDRLYGWDPGTAGLEGQGEYHCAWKTAAWFSCIRRKYGFDGKPLFCFQKAPADGFLHTGRCDGKAAGLCGGGVYQPDPSGL